MARYIFTFTHNVRFQKFLERLWGGKVQHVRSADEDSFGDVNIPGAGKKNYVIKMVIRSEVAKSEFQILQGHSPFSQ